MYFCLAGLFISCPSFYNLNIGVILNQRESKASFVDFLEIFREISGLLLPLFFHRHHSLLPDMERTIALDVCF